MIVNTAIKWTSFLYFKPLKFFLYFKLWGWMVREITGENKDGRTAFAHHFGQWEETGRKAGLPNPLAGKLNCTPFILLAGGSQGLHPAQSHLHAVVLISLLLLTCENICKATNKKVTRYVLWEMTSAPGDEWWVKNCHFFSQNQALTGSRGLAPVAC